MRYSLLLSFLIGTAALLLAPTSADAGIEACGDITLTAGVTCEVVAPGADCTTKCTPISVELSCAGQLQVSCDAECTGSASVECSGSCEGSCQAQCDVDPGSFNCATNCTASCNGSCESSCNDSSCKASCEANCSAHCDTECEVVPASADCMASCQGSCSGSCTAESTLSCQAECSSSGFATCTTDVQGGCETDCNATEGALFCDGQYVEADNLVSCIAALKAALDIEVTGFAEVTCEDGMCSAEAGVGCSASGSKGGLMSLSMLLLAFFFFRRRERCEQV